MTKIIEPTKCNTCISAGGGDCATCESETTPTSNTPDQFDVYPGEYSCIKTPTSPQPEYIITEEQLHLISMYANWSDTHARAVSIIRSRHAPSPQQKEYVLTDDVAFIRSKTMNCEGCESNTCAEVCQLWQEAHDNQTRNDTLDDVRKKYLEFMHHPCPELADRYNHCCDSEFCGLCTLDEVLESLRSKEQP